MSNQVSDEIRAGDAPGAGRVIVSTRSYREAAAAIDRLANAGFPVERATIVGRGLRLIEHIVGRRGAARAAGEGTVTGAAIGGVIGLVFGLFTVAEAGLGLGLLLWGIVTGAVAGALVGLISLSLPRRRRFDSITSVEPERYDLLVDEPVADEAKRHLREWMPPKDEERDES